MDRYIVRVRVIGQTFYIEVGSKRDAEKRVEQIKAHGYRHYDGNAVMQFAPRQIVDVTYKREVT